MASTIVRSRRKAKTPVEQVAELLAEYAPMVEQVKTITTRAEKIKEQLKTLLLEGGTLDEKKSRWIELTTPVGGIRAIKHERRVSTYIDSVLARKVLEKRARLAKKPELVNSCLQVSVTLPGSLEDVTKALEKAGFTDVLGSESLNQDAVMAAYARKEITAADVDAMTVESENYAFKLIAATS